MGLARASALPPAASRSSVALRPIVSGQMISRVMRPHRRCTTCTPLFYVRMPSVPEFVSVHSATTMVFHGVPLTVIR